MNSVANTDYMLMLFIVCLFPFWPLKDFVDTFLNFLSTNSRTVWLHFDNPGKNKDSKELLRNPKKLQLNIILNKNILKSVAAFIPF